MSNETIFSEVDEELRRERMRKLWRQFGPYIIGAAVAVVIAVGLNEGWQWWQNSNAARSSDQFYAALELAEAGDVAGAQTALDGVVASGSGNYPLLAQFRKAALLGALEAIGLTQYKAGDINGALSTFETIAADASTSSEIRQRVQVYIAQLVAEGATTSDPAADAADAAAAAEPVPADPTANPMMEAPPMVEAPAAPAAEPAPAETTTTNGG
jgi:hypothetical protein